MAVKARGSIGLTDLTDAYSVDLSTPAFSFAGDTDGVKSTQSFTCVVTGLRGTVNVPVDVAVADIVKPTGLDVTKSYDSSDTGETTPILTIQATTALTQTVLNNFGSTLIIPVSIKNTDVVLNKALGLSISLTGPSPYSITCGNEVQGISCDEKGNVSGAQTIVIPFSVFQGTSRKAATVTTSSLPSGITIPTNGNKAGTTSAEGSLTLNVANGSDLGGTNNGTITLTIKTGSTTVGTINFTWVKQIHGPAGTNTATVQLYQRAASSPAKPSADLTYTFATGVVSGTLGSWTQAVPDGTAQLWVITATAISTGATDTIGKSEWTGPVKLVKDGAGGYNQATIYLYKRAASAPAKPSSAVTYTFSSGALSAIPSGWSRSVPEADGNPCWITSAAAISQSASVSIAAAWWADVQKLAEDGEDSLTVTVVPSNGITFKNSSGSNTLTAHVYRGLTELTASEITALGAIKWYKITGSGDDITETYMTGKDGTQLTVSASEVSSTATFEARLETTT